MRRLLVTAIRTACQALVRFYYPRRIVRGLERVPREAPLLFVLNHPNGLLDPMVLRLAVALPARFLAKSTLFDNPLGRLTMEAFESIPVYRAHESGERGADPSRNEETFARCREALAAGQQVALFPEGASHSDPWVRPLKTGAARIALSAEAAHQGRLGLRVVPVGLNYERKDRFRSSVLVLIGQPLRVADYLDDYAADPRKTVLRLTEDVRQALETLVLTPNSASALDPRRAAWAEGGAAGELAFDGAGRDPAAELGAVTARQVVGGAAKLLAMMPLALVGAVLSWLPYQIAGHVASTVTRDQDLLGTVKLLSGVVFLSAGWLLEAAVVGALTRPLLGLVTLLAGATTGYLALRFDEEMDETALAFRSIWRRRAAGMLVRLLQGERPVPAQLAAVGA